MSMLRTAILGLAISAVCAPATAGEKTESGRPHVNAAQNGVAQFVERPEIAAKQPDRVAFQNGFKPRTVVIDTAARKLYFTLSASEAYVYPIAVGKPGFAWSGVEKVTRFASWPDWTPPAEMRQRKPTLPVRMSGGINNPLGAKAIYLGDTMYRIHGTNNPGSIGSAASSGCIRMLNGHVVHLAKLLVRGTKVYAMEMLPSAGPAMPPKVETSASLIEQSTSTGAKMADAETQVRVASR